MKKIFFMVSFSLLFSYQSFGQASVDIPVTVSDNTGVISDIYFGLDLTATDGIDVALGEDALPGLPPGGYLVAWLLPDFSTLSYRDYRAPGDPPAFPFTGHKSHIIKIQTDVPAGNPMTISWNLPPTISATSTIGNGANTVPFFGTGSHTWNYNPVSLSYIFVEIDYINIGGEPTPGPFFCLIPDYLNFGEVAFRQTKTLPVAIINAGYLNSLYIYNAVSSNPAFTIEPNSYPVIIAPLQSQIFNITYTGTFGGEYIDSILFYHNASGSPSRLNVHAETISPNPNCFAQVLSEIIVTDSSYLGLRILNFGLDSSGTDGIDPQLGEMDLPPFPPLGAFEARFFLPENNFSETLDSYCDFRYAVLPFIGQKEWRFAYQTGYGNSITIIWSFPPYITGVLQDFINGTFINVPMVDSGSFTVTDPFIFNGLRMLIDFNITTPVELTSLTTDVLENVIKLNWTTTTETNNSGFEIERLQDSKIAKLKDWETIGFVPGFGTTTEPKSYSFVDENVTTGAYKYRLKQIDFDGSFEYSNEIEVEVDLTPKEFVLYQNYPNPFNPSTSIQYAISSRQFVTLIVFDVLGNEIVTLVNEEKQAGVYEVEFNLGSGIRNPASGIYFYQLKAGSFIQTKKMILTK